MSLELVLKSIGWIFVLVPILAFLTISVQMVKGVAKEDETIMAIVLAGIGAFGIGAVLLLVLYLTDFFPVI